MNTNSETAVPLPPCPAALPRCRPGPVVDLSGQNLRTCVRCDALIGDGACRGCSDTE